MNTSGPECKQCGAWLVPPREEFCGPCETKIYNYANAKIKADKVRGYPEARIQDERSPDGRLIFSEMNGSMKRSIHERSKE